MRALFSFLPLFALQKARFFRALALSLLTLAAGIALLGVSGWFLTAAALTTAGVAFNLFVPSAGVRGLSFVRVLSRYGERLAGHDATLRFLSDIRRWVFGRMFQAMPLPGKGLARPDLVSRLVADVDALDNAFLLALGPISSAVLVCVAMCLGLAALLPGVALAYGLCFLTVALVVPAGLVAASRRLGTKVLAAAAELRRAVLDGLDAHQDLVALGQIDRATIAAGTASDQLRSARHRLALLAAGATAMTQVIAGAIIAVVLFGGLGEVQAGRLSGPLLVGLLLAVVASFEAAAPLVRGATRLSAAAAAAGRLQALASLVSPIAEPGVPVPVPAGGTLSFEHVGFRYGAWRAVLEDLCFTVAAGEHVAITGPSGAGKSTIAKLLVRLADPELGTIRLNGIEIRKMASAELRRQIALMTQDAPVFNDTVRANLLIGRPDADDEMLWRVLGDVDLAGYIRTLPCGLDTLVGEAGAGFSVGQGRRLALARTLLSPAAIIVLDEPTNGLDRDAEIAFFENLGQAAAGRTVILITHADLPDGVVGSTFRLVDGRFD